jgi:CO/xanthine dehydrogenase FAD-binding subunit
MIIEYHRPETIDETLSLLRRKLPTTVPLGGGTSLTQPTSESFAVVDLQELGLNKIIKTGREINIGATVTLQQLLETDFLFPALKKAIRLEATYNIRHSATTAGILVGADGRSPFSTGMLALSARLIFLPGNEQVYLGDYFPLRNHYRDGRLITSIFIPSNVKFTYHYVARTPADLPIVCASIAHWPSGRTRVALGGLGPSPVLAMDGPDPYGAEQAARSAFEEAVDHWAGGDYRSEVAGILVKRCLDELDG